MLSRFTRRTALTIGLLTLLSACSRKEVPYAEEIQSWRTEYDRFMREAADSPVVPEQRATFKPLNYFPIDPEYRTPAALQVKRTDDIMEMSTSSGQRRKMRRIGTLSFTLKGHALTLTAFVEAAENDMRRLFVPFGDLTNGSETYNGGRYLDLDRTATGIYDLDFNRAYHPYCLYNPKYECPIPPRENRMAVPVRAGARLGPGGH